MYYRLIENKRDEWFSSGKCSVRELVSYIRQRGKMRDAQFEPLELGPEGLEAIEMLSLDCVSADKDDVWHSSEEIKMDRLGYVVRNGRKTDRFWDGCICSDAKPLRLKIRNICGDESIYVL